MTNHDQHWEDIYATKAVDDVSWFQAQPTQSLELIKACAPNPSAHIFDAGSGASTLLDALLDNGYARVTALDISSHALEKSKLRLGSRADKIDWLVADITQVKLPESSVDVWHDRAVFHFLTRASDR
jgi:ubiquinone/menaquinone biosynthesis C-methylase UbiE